MTQSSIELGIAMPSKEASNLNSSATPPIPIDVSQQDAILQILPCLPTLTSYHTQWDGMIFTYHHQPAHTTPESVLAHHAVCLLTKGPIRVEQSIDTLYYNGMATSGDISIIPAGTTHRSRWDHITEFMVLLIDPVYLNQIAYESIDSDRVELEPRQSVRDPLIEQIGWLLKEDLESNGLESRLYVDSLITTFCAHLIHRYTIRSLPLGDPVTGLPRHSLRNALDFINAHLDQHLRLADIAHAAGMSQFYFARLFKQSTGITPYQYVVRQRVERAKQLLKQRELPIATIAHQCGFANQSHLIKHFRRFTGTTPKVYQEQ